MLIVLLGRNSSLVGLYGHRGGSCEQKEITEGCQMKNEMVGFIFLSVLLGWNGDYLGSCGDPGDPQRSCQEKGYYVHCSRRKAWVLNRV